MKMQHLFAAAAIVALGVVPAMAEGHIFPGKGETAKWEKANDSFNQGIAFYRLAKYPDAIAKYKQAITIYPYDYEYFNNLGLTYKKNGDLDLAIEALKKSIEMKPNIWESWSNLGNVYKHQRKPEEAIAAYAKALEYNPPAKSKQLLQDNIKALKSAPAAPATQ